MRSLRRAVTLGRYPLVSVLLALAGLSVAQAEDPPTTVEAAAETKTPKVLPPEQLKQRDALDQETNRAFAEGKLAEAIAATEKMLIIERAGLGDDHEEVDNSLQWLAELLAITGKLDEAGKLAAESLATQQRLHGEKHWRVSSARATVQIVDQLNKLDSAQRDTVKQASIDYRRAFRLYHQNKPSEALAPAQKSLDVRRKALGEDSNWTARSWLILGYVQQQLKKTTESATSLAQAAKTFEKSVGPLHPDVAYALEALATSQQTLEQYDAATKSIRQVATICKDVFGAKQARTQAVQGTLVYFLMQSTARAEEKDDQPAAQKLREEILAIQQQRFAEDDWRVTESRFAIERGKQIAALKPEQRKKLIAAHVQKNKSFALYQQDKSAEALPGAEQAVETCRQILGPTHVDTAAAINVVGLIASDLKDYAKAEAMLGKATELWRAARGDTHPDYSRGLYNLGCAHEQQGHWEEAAKLFRQSLAIRQAAFGPDDSDTQSALDHLGYVVEGVAGQQQTGGDFAAAQKAWTEAIELRTRRYGAEHWRTKNLRIAAQASDELGKMPIEQRKKLGETNAQLNQAIELSGQQKHNEALPLASKAFVARKAIVGAGHRDTIVALYWVGELQMRLGKYAEAEPFFKELEVQRKKLYGETHPTYVNSLDDLGRMYFLQDKTAESAKHLRRALAIRRETLGDGDPETQRSVNWLLEDLKKWAEQLKSAGDYAGAVKVRQEMLAVNLEHRGPDNWQTRDAQFKIKLDTRLGQLTPDERARLRSGHERLAECIKLANDNKNLEALAKAQDASQTFQEVLGDWNVDSVVANNSLAQLYQRLGDAKTADAILLRNQELVATELGKTHPDYAYALHNLANSYFAKNEFTKACPIYREAWQIRVDTQGEKHADTLGCSNALQICLDRLAAAQEKKSDFAGAKKSRQEKLTLLTAQLGDKHWQVNDAKWAAYQTDLVAAMRPYQREQMIQADTQIYNSYYWAAQRATEQEKGYNADKQKLLGFSQAIVKAARQALQTRQQILANTKNHPAIAEALDLLAEAQMQTGDYANAKINFEKSLAIRKATQGEIHPRYIKTNENLVAAIADSMALPFQRPSKLTPAQQQRLEQTHRINREAAWHKEQKDYESEQYSLEQMLQIEQGVYGEAHAEVAATYERLMENSMLQSDFDSAREYAARIVQIQTKLHGADSWRAMDARHQVTTLERMSRFNEQQWQQYRTVYNLKFNWRDHVKESQNEEESFRQIAALGEQAGQILRGLFGEDHQYYANHLDGMAIIYTRLGDSSKADELRRRAAEITARVLGNRHPMYLRRLNNIAQSCAIAAHQQLRVGNIAAAQQLLEKRLGIQLLHYGPQHWQVTKARGAVTRCQRLAKLSEQDRNRAEAASDTPTPGAPIFVNETDSGPVGVDRADRLRDDAKVCAELLGPDDLGVIDAQAKLGALLRERREYRQAIEVLQPAVEVACKSWGTGNPFSIDMLKELAMSYYAIGDYVQAENYFRRCRQALEDSGRTKDNRYANCLNSLAVLYEALGDYDRAETLLKQIITIRIPTADEEVNDDPDEEFYRERRDNKYETLMGEFSLASVLEGNNVGQGAPDAPLEIDFREMAKYVHNLGLNYAARRDFKQAESLLRQALGLMRHDDSEGNSQEYYDGLGNLAAVYESLGDQDRAEKLLTRIVQKRKGAEDPKFAVVLNNLGTINFRRGKLDEAGDFWRQAAKIRNEVLGVRHPAAVMSQANLAMLADRRGDVKSAVTGLEWALNQTNASLQLAATIQSERQQLISAKALRGYLDQYLSLSVRRQLPPESIYRHVLLWKGAVLARQRWMRSLQQVAQASKPAAKPDPAGKSKDQGTDIVTELAQINSRLSSITFGGLDYDARKKIAELDALAVRKDELERQLSRQIAALGANLQAVKLTPAELQGMLPEKTALVDLVEYVHTTWPSAGQSEIGQERRIAAFVVVAGKPIAQRDLGSAEAIEKLVDACREQWLKRKRPTEADPAVELRKLLWDPLVPALAGIDTVLISPDGAAARIPFAALPDAEPDSYLIDKWAIAIVPVPQLLGDILAKQEPANPPAATMLLVGDVAFGGDPGGTLQTSRGAKTPRGDKPHSFLELPGTRTEIEALQKIFQGKFKTKGVKLLDGPRATESEVRLQASQCRYLHLATHGFFAAPEFKPASTVETNPFSEDDRSTGDVAGWNPGLLSGVVLAGVNQPAAADRDDGILTAAEVSELNLSQTQLVVLSACETGLGQIAGGEGALGLQRAFQVAGARSVVSSLWKVDDEATQLLMTEFYQNLWKKNLSPLAAFREAQLSLLNAKVDVSKLRGLDVEDDAPAQDKTRRLSPRLWAAFVLSGSPN